MKIFNGNITQTNTGTLEGKLFNTFNCDLTYNKGKMSFGQQTIITTDTITNLGTPIGFKYFDTKWFTVAGTRVFASAGPTGNFVADSGTPTTCSSLYSDIENFGAVLLVAATGNLYSKAADGSGTGAYTSRRSFSGSTDYHALCSYNNRAYWLDISSPARIYSMDTSYSVSTSGSYTMQLPSDYNVTFMRAYSNGIYIGTIHKNGGEALVFDWDGVTENKWNRAYKVYANGALAGYVDNDVLMCVNTNAELLQFTGSGFKVVGRLPIKRDLLWKATNFSDADRFIHPNGLASISGRPSMLINNRLNSVTEVRYLDNLHSGIWEYDGTSLYHKHSLSYTPLAGTITDYGQTTLNVAGGLADVPDLNGTSDSTKGNFLVGASYYSTSSSSTSIGYGTWTDNYFDDIQKSAFFVTQQIRASHVTEMFNRITTSYYPTSGMSVVLKYRTSVEDHVDFNITWSSTTTFTTTQSGLASGDEITIFQGKGSGRVAHITGTPTFSNPNYTVTLDETIVGVSGTARARKQNWRKCGTITKNNTKIQ